VILRTSSERLDFTAKKLWLRLSASNVHTMNPVLREIKAFARQRKICLPRSIGATGKTSPAWR
jgi:hypothetical protein